MNKKLFTGAAIVALALSVGAVAYAATPQKATPSEGIGYQNKVSISNNDTFSFDEADKANLPEGVVYQDKISSNNEDGISFDENAKLPDGVLRMDNVSISNDNTPPLPVGN